MLTTLRSLRLLALIVGGSLRNLHIIGMVCAAVLIATTLLLSRGHRMLIFTGITAAMLALTAYSQYSIIPKMDYYRSMFEGQAALTNSNFGLQPCGTPKLVFDQLHRLSVRVEEAVMLGGLALVVMLARREE